MREDVLHRLLASAKARWPAVQIGASEVQEYLRARGFEDETPPHGDDLCLACALARGSDAACEVVEQEFVPALRPAVGRVDANEAFVDEVLQDLRVKVLAGEKPRIAKYSGKGPLGAWLRVAATRLALEHLRARGRRLERPLLERVGSEASSPEHRLFREKYRAALEEAIASAMSELDARDRNVLRMHFVSGLNIDAIGKAYNVHRATVARWVARARGILFERTRERLTHGPDAMSDSDFDSIVNLVKSEVDIHLSGLLASGTEAPDD